jgi:hypothetical protein
VRTAYDSTNPFDIPAEAAIVCGYVDGAFAWADVGWARFPNAVKVRIATQAATNDGHTLDVETGDANPWDAPGWAQLRRAAGVDPTVYVNLSNWNATRTEFQARGLAEPHWWLAEYDGIDSLPVGTVAKQYANPALTGAHYDLSCVADVWPGVDGSQGGFMALTDAEQTELLNTMRAVYRGIRLGDTDQMIGPDHPVGDTFLYSSYASLNQALTELSAQVATIGQGGGLTPAQAAELDAIKAQLDRWEAALKQA